MNQTTIRLEPNLKKDFANVCDDMGLSISSAITIFAKTVVRERRIPFEISTSKNFNATTIAAIEEIESGKGLKRFKNPDELFEELEEK
ncbi:MAG: type II toxin-antitoxin system RelB/DinJ family antitoxin [Oscillospiraceae bacterium]|nr:type II toxin-antitoxin system RelB/DinJ family antitoxin [Oscillospiraceae bacterium]